MTHTVDYSMAEQVHIIFPEHTNGYGRLFGGRLMEWIDELAGVVGKRHAGGMITTAAIDNIVFRKPAYNNQMIYMQAKITYVGKTSMEIQVDTYVENFQRERNLINRAFVVNVAIGEDGKPVEVPALELETEEQRDDWEAGRKRYELRKKRRKEGF